VKFAKSERLGGLWSLVVGIFSYIGDCFVGSLTCADLPFFERGLCAEPWFLMTVGIIVVGSWYLVFGKDGQPRS
jgi:hypothetical protein